MRRILVLASLAVLIAAGCGPQTARHDSTGVSLTPAAFRARVNGICRAFHAKAAALGAPRSLAQAVVWIDRMRPLVVAVSARLRVVRPPRADAGAYQRMIDSGGPAMRLAARLRQAAAGGELRRFDALAALSVRRQRRYDAVARSIGLTGCVGLR